VDVTEQVLARNQLEQRVRERTAELERAEDSLRTLNQTLMRAQDEERRRLALELHDGAGQLLVALRWKLGPLMENISVLRPELGQVAQDSLALVDELSNELRTVSHLLHPVVFGEGRLSPALRSYMAGLAERSGLVVDLEVDPHLPRMSPEIETTLFRIVQESLTNVYRHADTTTAAVRINAIGQNVCLEIKDNGSGIPGFFSLDDPTLKVGVGIQGMRERIRRLKGRFEIQSGKGGTTVTAVLPMSSGHEVASTKADTIN
jgi:signal transduction histidine kinase